MRGYSVDVGVIPIAERNQEGKVIRKQLGCAVLSLLSCITVASSNFDGLFSGALLRSPNPYNRIQKNGFCTYDPFSLISHISDRVL